MLTGSLCITACGLRRITTIAIMQPFAVAIHWCMTAWICRPQRRHSSEPAEEKLAGTVGNRSKSCSSAAHGSRTENFFLFYLHQVIRRHPGFFFYLHQVIRRHPGTQLTKTMQGGQQATLKKLLIHLDKAIQQNHVQ